MDEATSSGRDSGAVSVPAGAGFRPVGITFALVYLLANGALAAQGSGLLYMRIGSGGGFGSLSYFAAIGSVVALVVYPLIGALSDRTASPLLRRRLYLLLGAALASAGMVAGLVAQTLAELVLVWIVLQIGGTAIQLMLLVALPEMTPVRQRGLLAALVAGGAALGGLGGSLLVNQLLASQPTVVAGANGASLILFVALLAGGVLVSGALMALVWRSRPAISPDSPGDHAPYADFGWTAVSRVYLAAAVTLVETNVLQVLGPRMVLFDFRLVTYPETALILVAALATGLLSDRIGRRKPFVLAGALLTAAGALVLVLTPLAPASIAPPQFRMGLTILGGALLGAGSGTVLTTLLALATEVLPSPRHYARDLGWLQFAALLPAAILPFANLYFLLAAHLSPLVNYVGLVAVGALCAVLGGLAILRVRSAR